jgi:hypothetical protein
VKQSTKLGYVALTLVVLVGTVVLGYFLVMAKMFNGPKTCVILPLNAQVHAQLSLAPGTYRVSVYRDLTTETKSEPLDGKLTVSLTRQDGQSLLQLRETSIQLSSEPETEPEFPDQERMFDLPQPWTFQPYPFKSYSRDDTDELIRIDPDIGFVTFVASVVASDGTALKENELFIGIETFIQAI